MKKRITQRLLISLICSGLFLSCKFSKEKETNEETPDQPIALQVVQKGIENSGTMEKWKNIASLQYTKKSRLLLENG